MRFSVATIFAAVMAAVSHANPSEWDKLCFHCINEGYAFCSADGITGKCVDAKCKEENLQGQPRRDNRAAGNCTLETSCDTSGGNKAMTAFNQCNYSAPISGCKADVAITKEQIASGGIEKLNHAEELEYFPYQEKYTLPAWGVCKTKYSLKDGDFTGTNQKGGFTPTEWQEIDIMLTKLKDGATWSDSNSALYSAETFYYNSESDDGDLAGRVLIETKDAW